MARLTLLLGPKALIARLTLLIEARGLTAWLLEARGLTACVIEAWALQALYTRVLRLVASTGPVYTRVLRLEAC